MPARLATLDDDMTTRRVQQYVYSLSLWAGGHRQTDYLMVVGTWSVVIECVQGRDPTHQVDSY